MAGETETREIEMERAAIVGTSLEVSRVALGTWAKRSSRPRIHGAAGAQHRGVNGRTRWLAVRQT
jgi:hypothetical protein